MTIFVYREIVTLTVNLDIQNKIFIFASAITK